MWDVVMPGSAHSRHSRHWHLANPHARQARHCVQSETGSPQPGPVYEARQGRWQCPAKTSHSDEKEWKECESLLNMLPFLM